MYIYLYLWMCSAVCLFLLFLLKEQLPTKKFLYFVQILSLLKAGRRAVYPSNLNNDMLQWRCSINCVTAPSIKSSITKLIDEA